MTATVAQVNGLAASVAEMNGRIAAAVSAGGDAHDLADQRDRLVMQLGDLVGVQTRAGDNGTVDVFLGGSALVRGSRAEQLVVAEPGPLTGSLAASGLQRAEVQWAVDGSPAAVGSGQVAGLLTAVNSALPQATVDLDAVASRLVTGVNDLHRTGHGLDAVADVNLDFFDPAGTRASTVAVSADVAGQPSRIAAALGTSGALDSSLAQSIAALATSTSGADAAYQSMIGRLAVSAQAADRRSQTQQDVVQQADDARLSVSGVNLDEELTNLVSEQRSYEAAARLLTTIDETLDVLINRTGVVGR
jgi:flagellar hook-associated protein 1 FlgK